MGVTSAAHGHGVSWRGDKSVLQLVVVMFVSVPKYTNNHPTVHFKRVNWVLCDPNCNKTDF